MMKPDNTTTIDHANTDATQLKGKTGLRRLFNAFFYSMKGYQAAFLHKDAFRQECLIFAIALPVALLLPISVSEKCLLCLTLFFVIIAELINSATEAVVDRIGTEIHPLSARAKDIGSAAVLTTLLMALLTWGLVLWNLLIG